MLKARITVHSIGNTLHSFSVPPYPHIHCRRGSLAVASSTFRNHHLYIPQFRQYSTHTQIQDEDFIGGFDDWPLGLLELPESERRKQRNALNPNPKIHINPCHSFDIGLMYPQTWYPKYDPTGWWVTDKLAGMRAYWDGNKLYFATGGEINAPKVFIDQIPKGIQFDGELAIGGGNYQKVHNIVHKLHGHCEEEWENIVYHVFDVPGEVNKRYEDRVQYMKEVVPTTCENMKMLTVRKSHGNKDLSEDMERVIRAGGYGVVLRKPQSYYESGMSSSLFKYERHNYCEARVIEQRPDNTLHCLMANNCEIDIPVSPQDPLLLSPTIGKIVKFTYGSIDKDGRPQDIVFRKEKPRELWGHDFMKVDEEIPYYLSYGVKLGGVPRCCGCKETLRNRDKLRILTWGTFTNVVSAPPYPAKYSFCTKRRCIELAFEEFGRRPKSKAFIHLPKFDGKIRIPLKILMQMKEQDETDLIQGDLEYRVMDY